MQIYDFFENIQLLTKKYHVYWGRIVIFGNLVGSKARKHIFKPRKSLFTSDSRGASGYVYLILERAKAEAVKAVLRPITATGAIAMSTSLHITSTGYLMENHCLGVASQFD